MSRRWLAQTSGLVVSAMFVTTAWSQTSEQPASLAERMAALRRGWSQDQPTANPEASSRANNARRSDGGQREESPSFWTNFLNRRDQPAEQENNFGPALVPRTASQPRTGSAQAQPARPGNYTLPGLGGSPLPQPPSAPTGVRSPGGPDLTQEFIGNNTNVPSNARPSTVQGGTVRQSPHRRTAPQIDPEQLRRELSGSFPTSPGGAQTAPRTARAATTRQTEQSGGASDRATTDRALGQPTANGPLTLPGEAEARAFQFREPVDKLPAAGEPEPVIANEIAHGSPFESTRRSSEAGPALGAAPGPGTRNSDISSPAEQSTARGAEAFGVPSAVSQREPGLLVTNQTPLIATDIRGPKQILLGREAAYQIELRNQSEVAADGMVASIRIPSWAEVVNTATSQGTIQQSGDTSGAGPLEWQLLRLEAHGKETLDIRLIPRASRPLELSVAWTFAPTGSRAVVEVQEPKLQMMVSGPDEVLFSEAQVFRLTLSNPGTGVAENVKIDLMPPGGGEKAVTSHPIGDLAPGASKTVEVELTANEAGKLFVKAAATAEGGLSSEASKEIFCRKPELEVDWRGPESKYAGTPANYFFRVRNPGTAPAENVTVRVTLPEGAEFTSASEGQAYDAKEREVEWQVGTLGPGDDSYMELKCVVNAPGMNQIRVTAAASSGNLTATKLAETNIIALADLKLAVSDPSGPVAVGTQAVYEIRVQNRGSNTANDVNIVALFSDGIEPDQVEGAMYTTTDGRVTFRTIDELQAGREIVLRIRARASKEGTHVFRAEVLCRDLEIKLAAEETTRFYAEDAQPEGSEAKSPTEGFNHGFESAAQ